MCHLSVSLQLSFILRIRFQRCDGLFPSVVGLNQNVSDVSWPNITRSVSSLDALFLLFFKRKNSPSAFPQFIL